MTRTTNRLLVPYDEARHQLGDIGRTKFYELIAAQLPAFDMRGTVSASTDK